jgi:segregation and condensation protein B
MPQPITSIIESILFVHGGPITIKKLAEIAGVTIEEIQGALANLTREYQERGFTLLQKDHAVQLGSNPANTPYIADLMRSEFNEELSRSALETLAIIAYKGPLSRAEIEYVRGVNSSFILRNLLMRGLIERVENPRDSRSYRYRAGIDFLKHLGIATMEELPGYIEFKNQRLETQDPKDIGAHAP